MGSTRLLLWLLPRRFGSSWVLLAITAFGILAAVTLIAVGAIYATVDAAAPFGTPFLVRLDSTGRTPAAGITIRPKSGLHPK